MELTFKSPKYGDKIVLIDDEDYKKVKALNWSITFVRGNWYAIHSLWRDGKSEQIKMHRFIMSESDPKIKVDHINHNGLDNRKSNLRRATTPENTRNTGPTKRNRTGYKGVYHAPGGKVQKYGARIKVMGKTYFGGYFNCPIEAAKKYNELAKIHHGEFAYLNKIPNE